MGAIRTNWRLRLGGAVAGVGAESCDVRARIVSATVICTRNLNDEPPLRYVHGANVIMLRACSRNGRSGEAAGSAHPELLLDEELSVSLSGSEDRALSNRTVALHSASAPTVLIAGPVSAVARVVDDDARDKHFARSSPSLPGTAGMVGKSAYRVFSDRGHTNVTVSIDIGKSREHCRGTSSAEIGTRDRRRGTGGRKLGERNALGCHRRTWPL